MDRNNTVSAVRGNSVQALRNNSVQVLRIDSAQARRNNSTQAWKKAEHKKTWRSMMAIFIAIFLGFASLNGIIKTFAAGKAISQSKWDGISSFSVSLGDRASSLFIFQKDPKRAVILQLGDQEPFGQEGLQIAKNLSVVYGASISNYIKFVSLKIDGDDEIKKQYQDFTSIFTPLRLITGGWGNGEMNTNISRIDAFKLWWQLKDFGVNELKIADLSKINDKAFVKNGKKVLGADTAGLNREIAKYLENAKVVGENYQINIVNSSGELAAGGLAANFITVVGARVGSVIGDQNVTTRCALLIAKDSYTASYLAKMFDCDIKDAAQNQEEGQMTLTLGSEFAEKYFGQ